MARKEESAEGLMADKNMRSTIWNSSSQNDKKNTHQRPESCNDVNIREKVIQQRPVSNAYPEPISGNDPTSKSKKRP